MERDNLMIKCCHCEKFFPANEAHTLRPDWDETKFYMCDTCLENIPKTSEERTLYVHKKD